VSEELHAPPWWTDRMGEPPTVVRYVGPADQAIPEGYHPRRRWRYQITVGDGREIVDINPLQMAALATMLLGETLQSASEPRSSEGWPWDLFSVL